MQTVRVDVPHLTVYVAGRAGKGGHLYFKTIGSSVKMEGLGLNQVALAIWGGLVPIRWF